MVFWKKKRSRLTQALVSVFYVLFDDDMFFRYFLSTEDDPKRRHLYRYSVIGQFGKHVFLICLSVIEVVDFWHSADTIPPFNRCCLSCEFKCGYMDVSFSNNMQYFLLSCKGETRWPWTTQSKAVFTTQNSSESAEVQGQLCSFSIT